MQWFHIEHDIYFMSWKGYFQKCEAQVKILKFASLRVK